MPQDSNPVNLHGFSPQFVKVYNKIKKDNTPGLGTFLLTVTFLPLGMLSEWYYQNELKNLDIDVNAIANDSYRKRLVELDCSLEALNNSTLVMSDFVRAPLSSLHKILEPNILNSLKVDKDRIDAEHTRVSRDIFRLEQENKINYSEETKKQINDKKAHLGSLKSKIAVLRENKFPAEMIDKFFPLNSSMAQREQHLAYYDSTKHQNINNTVNYSFVISFLSHPATFVFSPVLLLAALLVFGLVSPLTPVVIALASAAATASLGLFSASCIASSINSSPLIGDCPGQSPI